MNRTIHTKPTCWGGCSRAHVDGTPCQLYGATMCFHARVQKTIMKPMPEIRGMV